MPAIVFHTDAAEEMQTTAAYYAARAPAWPSRVGGRAERRSAYPGAETHGGWGEAVDGCAMPAGALQRLCREVVGGCGVARRAEAACSDRGCLRPCACATGVERREHVVTQGAHRLSPFVRRVLEVRRKTAEMDGGREVS